MKKVVILLIAIISIMSVYSEGQTEEEESIQESAYGIKPVQIKWRNPRQSNPEAVEMTRQYIVEKSGVDFLCGNDSK